MSYLVLARKYRPQTFEDLVGQEHVARTLQNALKSGRLAHAYLFTGARGVGKTTSARILARALNCKSTEGPTPTPCGVCAPCQEIAAGSDLDVQEMDAASRTSVDDIRELQKTLVYVPGRDRFKVYIVDEVHMLSASAFNAFLKTLEEPPAHVKFIFATTEPHKIPVTVLSRCQRYDFRLIDSADIAAALQGILTREGIEADESAIRLVAREAAGSMRDALSLMDQVVAFSAGERLDGAQVARVLGIADRRLLFDLGGAIVGRDARRALEGVAEVALSGHDVVHFSRELLGHLRNLVVVKIASEPGRLLDAPDAERKELLEQAAGRSLVDLERLFLAFSRDFEEIGKSATPRLLLEMAVARLAHDEPLVPIDDLLGRLEGLERRLSATGSSRVPDPRRAGAVAPARPVPRAQGEVPSAPAAAAPPVPAPPAPALEVPVGRAVPPRAAAPATPAPSLDAHPAGAVARALAEPGAADPIALVPRDTPAGGVPDPEPTEPIDVWRSILGRVGADSRVLRSVLEHAAPLEVSARTIRVSFAPTSFHGRIATERENLDILRRAAQAHFGQPVPVEVSLARAAGDASPRSSSELRAADDAQKRAERVKAAEELPAVKNALSVFGPAVRRSRRS